MEHIYLLMLAGCSLLITVSGQQSTTQRITPPALTNNLNCTFEDGYCNWKQSSSDIFDWTRHRGLTKSSNTGPLYDHTTGSYNGWYLYIEASLPRRSGDTAALVYTTNSPISGGCISFYYHMYGEDIGSLRVESKNDAGKSVLLWNGTKSTTNRWHLATIPIWEPTNEISITGTVIGRPIGDIAIDDVIYRETCSAGPLDCTFENGTCGWTQNSEDDFNWRKGRLGTPSSHTGPTGDHTTGSGHYMYIEASDEAADNQAILDYRFDGWVDNGCFSFWYHMYGRSVGSLEVTSEGVDRTSKSLWKKEGTQSPDWILAELPIARAIGMISIRGRVGAEYQSDIAIDDVSYSATSCSNSSFLQQTGHGMDCSFDSGLCDWKQDVVNDTFDWTLYKGRTDSLGTGPYLDHTTGAGMYLYIETSEPRRRGDFATVSYTFPQPENGGCMSLFYHMSGSGVGKLNVTARFNNKSVLIASLDREQGPNWKQLQTYVPSSTDKIMITGSVRETPQGDIAIDDVTYSSDPCPLHPNQVQRLEFEARYAIRCTVLSNPVTRDMIFTSAKKHGHLVKQICGADCATSAVIIPELRCENGNLVIRWATDTTFLATLTGVPTSVASKVLPRLFSHGKHNFQVTTGTSSPPIVYPDLNKLGMSLEPVLKPFCTGKSKYSEIRRTCV